jgi:hypothetical protein
MIKFIDDGNMLHYNLNQDSLWLVGAICFFTWNICKQIRF